MQGLVSHEAGMHLRALFIAFHTATLAGREAPGKAFRLFTEASFNQLAATTLPEIQRVNLATVALQLKALGFDDLLAFDFMDRPPTAAVLRALETLYALGALDDSGMPINSTTPLILVAQPGAVYP